MACVEQQGSGGRGGSPEPRQPRFLLVILGVDWVSGSTRRGSQEGLLWGASP